MYVYSPPCSDPRRRSAWRAASSFQHLTFSLQVSREEKVSLTPFLGCVPRKLGALLGAGACGARTRASCVWGAHGPGSSFLQGLTGPPLRLTSQSTTTRGSNAALGSEASFRSEQFGCYLYGALLSWIPSRAPLYTLWMVWLPHPASGSTLASVALGKGV